MNKVKPVLIKEGKLFNQKEMYHPSFGCVTVSRVQSSNEVLFGSDIKHSTYIKFKVSNANLMQGGGVDYPLPKKMIVEFAMSPNQFSEMITSLNIGTGTPITLKVAPTIDSKLEILPDICNEADAKEVFSEDAKKNIVRNFEKIMSAFKEVKQLGDNKTISKKEFANCVRSLDIALNNLPNNLKFALGLIDEKAEKVVTEAKAEVEAYTSNKLLSIGIQSIKEQQKLIEK